MKKCQKGWASVHGKLLVPTLHWVSNDSQDLFHGSWNIYTDLSVLYLSSLTYSFCVAEFNSPPPLNFLVWLLPPASLPLRLPWQVAGHPLVQSVILFLKTTESISTHSLNC